MLSGNVNNKMLLLFNYMLFLPFFFLGIMPPFGVCDPIYAKLSNLVRQPSSQSLRGALAIGWLKLLLNS